MGTSLIIPAYNEEENISKVIEGSLSFVDEIIVVDDGSVDNTSKIASEYPVKMIKHKINLGKGEALKSGAKLASKDILVFIDGDGQHAPSDISSLVEPIVQGKADMVIGHRILEEAPWIRKFSNFMAKKSIKFFTKQEINDPLCGFRAIRKNAFDKFILTKKGYEFEFDMIFEALQDNLKIINASISVDYKVGISSITFKDNAKIIFFVLKKALVKIMA